MTLILVQIRVLIALILRETRATFGTSQIGYAWAIITPAIGVGLLAFIFSLIGRAAPFGQSMALFFATGLLTVEFFNRLSTTLMTGIDANKSLMSYPNVQALDVLIARSCLITITYSLIMTLFYTTLIMLGLATVPHHPEVLIQAFFATAYLGTSFGIFNAAIITLWDSYRHVEKTLTRPLIFISGVFYVPALLPIEATTLLWWNPVIHLVEWIRLGFYATYPDTLFTPWWPISLATGFLMTGLTLERFTRYKRSLA